MNESTEGPVQHAPMICLISAWIN